MVMENTQDRVPCSLKHVCDAALAGIGSDGRLHQEEVLNSLFDSRDPVLHEVPAVKALRRAVRVFVLKHASSLNLDADGEHTAAATAAAARGPLDFCGEILRGGDSVDAFKVAWQQVLENTFNTTTPIRTTTPTAIIEGTEASCDDDSSSTALGEAVTENSGPSSDDVLRFYDGDAGVSGVLSVGPEALSCNNSREVLESFVQHWVQKGLPIEVEKVREFFAALRQVVESDIDAIFLNENWAFWEGALLACIEHRETSLDAIALVEAMYGHCLTQQSLLLLVRAITERVERIADDVSGAKDNLLHLLHRLLLLAKDDLVLFMDDEIGEVLVRSLRVVLDHINSFDGIDPQARWLNALLLHLSVHRDVASLPISHPEIIDKLVGVMPAVHAIGLTLIMLPIWMKKHSGSKTFRLLFDGVVNAVMKGHVLHVMLDDAMACVKRCVHKIPLERRYSHFRSVCDALICFKYDEEWELVSRHLRLLLCFALPSADASDKCYKPPSGHLHSVEEKLLKRTEKWSNVSPVHLDAISLFWWELLWWHAADLPRVVARVVKTVCRCEKRLGVLWDEGHLVAISHSIPVWRGLEEVLESEQRAGSLNYVLLLEYICTGGVRVLREQQQQQQQQPHLTSKVGVWWMLMRWCTNAYARRSMFLATTEAIRTLMGDKDVSEHDVLVVPVEEFDVMAQVPHSIPLQDLQKQRTLAMLLSIRLWLASLCPPVTGPTSGELDVVEMVLQQLRTYRVDDDGDVAMPQHQFGDDSLLLLLCVYTMGTLTGGVHAARRSGNNSQCILWDVLHRLLEERQGFDPIVQLLRYLTIGVGRSQLAPVLAHRFEVEAVAEEKVVVPTMGTDNISVSSLVSEELHSLLDHLSSTKSERDKDTLVQGSVPDSHLHCGLLLLLQLHAGDVSQTAAAFRAYPLSQWEAYWRCTELAVGVVQRLLDAHPHTEELLQCMGVDVYYISLLCISRWLRDPVNAADLASTSIEKFMHLGQRAWESVVAASLYAHMMAIWEQLVDEGCSPSCSWVEVGVFPVSLFWTLCLTRTFEFS